MELESTRKGDGVPMLQGFVIFAKNGQVKHDTKMRITEIQVLFLRKKLYS